MLASSAAGIPSSARAPSGVSANWIPDWLPSWVIMAGEVCSPPSRISCVLAGWRGSGCRVMTSGSSSVTIIVSHGEGSPRCVAGSMPACRYPVHQAT